MRDSLDLSVRYPGRRSIHRKKIPGHLGGAGVRRPGRRGNAALRPRGSGMACRPAPAGGRADRFSPAAVLFRQAGGTARGNARLRAELAETSGLQAENEALRTLLQSPAADALHGAQPLQVAERWLDGFALAGSAEPGSAVLDPCGRFVGRIADSGEQTSPGILQVDSAAGTPCLAEGYCGVLDIEDGIWYLDELPRHCPLTEDAIVTTADGYWVGRLAAAPVEDETGLSPAPRCAIPRAEAAASIFRCSD